MELAIRDNTILVVMDSSKKNVLQYFSKKFKQFYGVEPKTITKSRNKNEK